MSSAGFAPLLQRRVSERVGGERAGSKCVVRGKFTRRGGAMGCAGSKAEAPGAPEPSETPAAEAPPPQPARQKSAMKSSSSSVPSGKEPDVERTKSKVGFSAPDDEALKARRTTKDEVPIDEDQVDLELERPTLPDLSHRGGEAE